MKPHRRPILAFQTIDNVENIFQKSTMLRNAVKKTSIRSVSADLVTPPPWDLSELRQKWRTADFPVKELQHFTEGDNQEKRQKFRNVFEKSQCFLESLPKAVQGRKHLHRELLAQPEFVPQYNIPLEQVKTGFDSGVLNI